MDAGDLREVFREHRLQRVKLGAFDMDGILRGKYISLDKFWSAAESGLGFCDVVFGWDIGDALYDNAQITGWHTGFPDTLCRIDLDTLRPIPWEPGTGLLLMDFADADGKPLPIAPRQVFQRVLSMAAERGYEPHFSAEYEFFIFRETPQSLREKNFANLAPLTPGMFGYSVLRASANAELVTGMLDSLAAFSVPVEGFHTETGPGVFEAAIAAAPGLQAADRAALFKTAVKEMCAKRGLVPTFMAKWNADLPGSSGHLHQSLWSKGQNLFQCDGGMSPLMQQYVAGLVENMADFTALFCPSVNSYKRTVPGAWAPVNATWAVDNRTTAVRAIPGPGKSARVETRVTGADINPYIAMAASLAAGLDGIERGLKLPPAARNGYSSDAPPLPRSLKESAARLRDSQTANLWLGEEFIDHYARTRDWEVRQFEKAVTDWELARYFESI